MTQLNLTDWAVCLAYLLVVFGLAVLSARGQQTNEDYFVGGRKMNWWVVGISMFATSFSSISFLGLPQRGAYQDFSFYLTLLFIPFVITPILWFIFVPMFVRMNVSSGYEYLGSRFGLPTQKMGSILYCAYALGWMGTMLYAIAMTMQTVMELSDLQYYFALIGLGAFATIYTAIGGLKAVIWTDFMQAIVLGGAILVVMLLAVGKIDGGWSTFWQVADAHEKFTLIHLDFDLSARGSFFNLFSVDNFTGRNTVFTAAAYGLFMYLPGYAVSQNMIQRYVCSGSLSGGRGIVLLSAVINTVLGFFFLLVGTALFVFYNQSSRGGLPIAGPEAVIATEDQILPFFVSSELPGFGFVGLILAGLFAAAMSTIDSGINGVSSVIVYDWFGGRQLTVRHSRRLTILLGAVVVAAALFVPVLGENILQIINVIAGTCLGMLLAIYLLGMYIPWANQPGALVGMAAGVICLAVIQTTTNIPNWWYGGFTMTATLAIGSVASLFFPRPSHSGTAADSTQQVNGDVH